MQLSKQSLRNKLVNMLLWFWDIFMVALKKFKIPVAIDLQNDDYLKDTKQEEN